jgi:phage terminase large subunit-like protein
LPKTDPTPWVRTPDDAVAVAEGCTFDPDAGAFVAEFLARFCRHSIGRWAGEPLTLQPWQRDIVDQVYGWKRPDGTRRFREVYVEVPKKNGKSTLWSGLELYHLVADGENAPEVYTGARDKKQASDTIFKELKNMISSSPDLKARLEVLDGERRVIYPKMRGFLQVLSADSANKEGFNASFTNIDELHAQATPDLYYTLRYAGAAREQPLFAAITTAGVDRESICYQVHETARQVLDGTISDTTFFGRIYAAEDGDDFEDPAVWRKANPSLGITIREDDFARDLKAAKRSPSDWATFLRYRLNVWVGAVSRFLPRPAWDACAGDGPILECDLIGASCFGGLDLASTTDLAAFAALFADGRVRVHCWAPEEGLLDRARRDRVDYAGWARQGFLTLTPGNVIDYDRIRADLLLFHAIHPITLLGVDPWNATQLVTQLTDQDGLKVEMVRQGYATLSPATKELERQVLAGVTRHGNNPLLNWAADNACVTRDANDNVRLSKRSSRGRIDPLSALVNAYASRLSGNPGTGGPSVYSGRGLFALSPQFHPGWN